MNLKETYNFVIYILLPLKASPIEPLYSFNPLLETAPEILSLLYIFLCEVSKMFIRIILDWE